MLPEPLSNEGFGLGERDRDFPDSLFFSDPKSDLEGEVDMVDDAQVWETMRGCGFLEEEQELRCSFWEWKWKVSPLN